MPREAEPSINERAFLLEALRQDIRLDGRAFHSFRNLQLTFGDEYGAADVRLGKTRVFTRISAEVAQPYPDRKFDGIFTINTELSPMASPAFEVGRQTELEGLLSRILEKAIRRSSALDTESLCILAGAKVWSILATVHVLTHDGNLIDASCISILSALRHFRRPDVSIAGETVTIHPIASRVPVPLAILHHPFCVTAAFFEHGTRVIVDATLLEQQCSEGQMVVTANEQGDVCQISKLGGVPTDALVLLRCVEVAVGKVRELSKVVSRGLEEDTKKRDKGGLMAELSAENAR